MIDLYTWSTPNGRKASVMLEEVGLPYTVHPINIMAGDQNGADFRAVNPNGKIPAIVDPDGLDGQAMTIFESGAILMYLAEKTGSDLLPSAPEARYAVMQWLMFQMGGVGPMFGQFAHFVHFAKEDVPYAKDRYSAEVKRLYAVMDEQLSKNDYLAGANYSIADISTYPWVARYEWHPIDIADFPSIKRWYETISARPAVQKGMNVPAQ